MSCNYLPSLSYPLDHESKSFLLLPVFLFGCLHYIINRQNLDDVPTLHVQKEFSRMERFPKNAFNEWFHNKTFLLRHMSWNKSHDLVKWTLVESTINSQFDNSMFLCVNKGVEVCFFFYSLYKRQTLTSGKACSTSSFMKSQFHPWFHDKS